MREMFGDRFSLKPRSRKHRYIFINAKGRRRAELLSKLLYPLEPYPKRLQDTDTIDVGQERNTPDPLTDNHAIGRDKSTAEDRQ
jgi:hypothetical protein